MNNSKLIDELNDALRKFITLLTKEQRMEFRKCIFFERFKKNEIIYRDGEVPQYLHCLMSGKVKLYKEGVGGRTQIMRVMKPYEFFGYRAYLANENYVNNAGAFESCTICMVPIEFIEKIISENNKVSMYFIRLLASELGTADERLVNLTQKHIRGRLAEALLFLEDTYGLDEDGNISIYLSREDLASLSNMTTSNAIRTLSAFQNENIIVINGRKLRILDRSILKKIDKLG